MTRFMIDTEVSRKKAQGKMSVGYNQDELEWSEDECLSRPSRAEVIKSDVLTENEYHEQMCESEFDTDLVEPQV